MTHSTIDTRVMTEDICLTKPSTQNNDADIDSQKLSQDKSPTTVRTSSSKVSHKFSQAWLTNFVEIYQTLSTNNLHLLEDIYHQDVTFIDPIHTINGYDQLKDYFDNLYMNLSTCDFVINDVIEHYGQAAVYWTMTFQHSKLNKGQPITVEGTTHLKGEDDKVTYHHDYLDLGQMLYEHLPFIGKIIQWLKHRASA